MEGQREPIVTRYDKNPILTPCHVPYPVETVHNAGVVKHRDTYVMLFRSHLRNGRSIIGIANSRDGINFKVGPAPFLVPSTAEPFSTYEAYGVEDPRISAIEEEFYITYSAYSRYGVRTALAKTRDFKQVERMALISQADCRNMAIFPEKIKGLYVRLDRPHSEICPWSIWISYSPDLVYWGNSRVVITPMPYHWDEMKVGPGAPPIKTDKGWLNIFHGVFKTMDGAVYRLGAALHDLNDPSRVIGVADDWILAPRDPWEISGYVHNVVFCCGAVPEPDGTIKLYWGGADTVMCTGTVHVEALLDLCLGHSRPDL